MTSGSRADHTSAPKFEWEVTADAAVATAVAALADAAFAPGIEAIDRYRNEFAAVEALLIAVSYTHLTLPTKA